MDFSCKFFPYITLRWYNTDYRYIWKHNFTFIFYNFGGLQWFQWIILRVNYLYYITKKINSWYWNLRHYTEYFFLSHCWLNMVLRQVHQALIYASLHDHILPLKNERSTPYSPPNNKKTITGINKQMQPFKCKRGIK